jgi:hypothetical protein
VAEFHNLKGSAEKVGPLFFATDVDRDGSGLAVGDGLMGLGNLQFPHLNIRGEFHETSGLTDIDYAGRELDVFWAE